MAGLPPAIVDNTVTIMPSWVTAAHTYYGWAKIADVQAEFINALNMGSSAEDPNVVAQCITQSALEILHALAPYYVMPYAGTDAGILASLNEYNSKLAASMIVARVWGASSVEQSAWGVGLRAYVEARLLSVIHGEERWDATVGRDAVPMPALPAYPHDSAVALISPSPLSGDPYTAQPIFTMSGLHFKKPAI